MVAARDAARRSENFALFTLIFLDLQDDRRVAGRLIRDAVMAMGWRIATLLGAVGAWGPATSRSSEAGGPASTRRTGWRLADAQIL